MARKQREKPEPGEMPAILVVEDDEDILDFVTEYLADLGYTVYAASNAEEALGLLRDEVRIDVLFTDILMPGGRDGVALAREAARLRPNLKILYTTGYAGAGQRAFADPGAVLRKPYRPSGLQTKLAEMLNARPLAWDSC